MNKYLTLAWLSFILLLYSPLSAQKQIEYKLETFGSLGSGDFTPFWITHNTYGVAPLKANNAYIRANANWSHSFSEQFKLEAGMDLLAAAHHTSTVWVQQLYADLSYRSLKLSIGPKERYNSMLDKRLSTGDMNYSTNARPIPEINFSFPEFTTVPFTNDILMFKADFAVGKSFENDYILETKNFDTNYAQDILWHHKSLFFKLEDPQKKIPLSFILGLDHAVQWGGWTTHENFGKMTTSFKDFLRIVMGQSGGSGSIETDQVNVLGNHQGTYNVKLAYEASAFKTAIYKQHYYDDNSGLEYANWRDGIWGLEAEFFKQSYLKKIVLEYVQTTNQSGPMHFLNYDPTREIHPRGGGNDDYYNHVIYYQGWSYFGRTIGNPLITSPAYNNDGQIHFKNNRIKALHFGAEGTLSAEITYRALFTGMQAWGRMQAPFLNRKDNFSALLEGNYQPRKLQGWNFGLQLAFDTGDLYGDSFGASFKIRKTGRLLW